MISPSDFDWRDTEAVTVREQMAIAVHTNVNGAIVIRQERAWDEDSDTIILIQPENARTVAEAILAEADVDRPLRASAKGAGVELPRHRTEALDEPQLRLPDADK